MLKRDPPHLLSVSTNSCARRLPISNVSTHPFSKLHITPLIWSRIIVGKFKITKTKRKWCFKVNRPVYVAKRAKNVGMRNMIKRTESVK